MDSESGHLATKEVSRPFRVLKQVKRLCFEVFVTRKLLYGEAVRFEELELGEDPRESPLENVFRKYAVEGSLKSGGEVLRSEKFLVIKDRTPNAELHLLVLPRKPILSVLSLRLGDQDASMIEEMVEIGKDALRKFGATDPESQWRFSFHIPPFTSVDHLHLHCLSGKLNCGGVWKFERNKRFCISAAELARGLRAGL